MTIFLENFWGNVIRSSTNSLFNLSLMFNPSWKTEITYFCFHIIVDEDITKFEVSMDDWLRMNILHCFY